ncbi:hypothetical protein JCM12294_34760 [Desulfocicer niacini]
MFKTRALALFLIFFTISINTPYSQAAAPFKMQIQEGEDLVKQFKATFNRKPLNMKMIQEQAFRISQHYQAKYLLKNKYPGIGRLYHDVWKKGSDSLNRRIIERAKQKLREKNYSGKAVDGVEPIQNTKSLQSASAPMDLDAGVQTKTPQEIKKFMEELRGQGKTPKGYLDDLQQALEEAYVEIARDVGAYRMDPKKAFITGTAAWHPDAYKDLDVLSGKAPGKELIEQSADVSKNKIYEFRNMAEGSRGALISPEAAIQEAGRGVQKDMSKMNAVFDEIEKISGYRPRLSAKNQQVLGLLDGLKELKDPNVVRRQIEALTDKNYFDALAELMDNMESSWKLAPATQAQGMVASIMKKVLSDTEFEYFISKYKPIGLDNLTGRAGQVSLSLKKMSAACLLSMQDSASSFVSSLKSQYPNLSKAGDKVADLMNYVKKTTAVDSLADIVGKSAFDEFAKIKKRLPQATMTNIAGRYIKNAIPLSSIDKETNRMLFGDVDGNLRMETFMGTAMALYEMKGIIDKNLSPEAEKQQLTAAFARNLPIVGDFFQGVVDGHQGYLEGDKKKVAMAGAYLVIGAAGLVPGGQVPALIAGLGMVTVSLGGSAWDISREKALIEAWLASGEFESEQGKIKGLWTKQAGLREILPDQLLNTSDLNYKIGFSGTSIQVTVHEWGERYFVTNQSNVPVLRLAFKNIYPDFDLDATLREPYNIARSQLAARILETGGKPARDVALGIFLQLKRIQDQAAGQALDQIRQIVEKEYQARHFTGEALEIYRKLKELGEQMRLPLIENTQEIFKSFGSFVTKALTFPWVRDSLSLQQVTLQKRYYDGFLEIQNRIKNIASKMEEVGLNPPTSFHLTGFLEVDGPRMKDLENAYLVKGIGQARKDAASIHKAAGLSESFDMKKDCGQELFVKLARIQMSLVHSQDLKLLMARWQGKKSAAMASRDAEFERVKQSISDSRLPSSTWDKLSRNFEACYAWSSASLPGSGGYEVYSDAQDAIESHMATLENQYKKIMVTSRDEYLTCKGAHVDVKVSINGPVTLKIGESGTFKGMLKEKTGSIKQLKWKWRVNGKPLYSTTDTQTVKSSKPGIYNIEVRISGLVGSERKILATGSHTVIVKKAEQISGDSDGDITGPNDGKDTILNGEKGDLVPIKKQEAKKKATPSSYPDDSTKPTSDEELSFAGSAPNIWKGGNYKKDFGERGFYFKRTKAEGGPLDKKWCPGKACINGTVSGKINPSFSPSSEEEILKELKDRVKYHKKWSRVAEIKPYRIGDFKGYLLTTKLHYSRGYYDGGYVSSGTSAYGEGWVLKGKETIRVEYLVGGSGCFNNSQRAFQEFQTKAAKSEADSILAGLQLIVNGKFTSTLYTGPKLDGSDMLKVTLMTLPKRPSFLGETVEVTAQTSGGKSPYTYTWTGDHGGKGAKVLFASRKAGDHQLSVTITDAKGDTATASITIKVEALKVIVKQDSPVSSTVILGTPVLFSAKVEGGDKSKQEYLWQPHPEVAFDPFDNSLNTKAIFSALGTYNVWIQVFHKDNGRRITAGESQQLELEVVSPKLSLSSSKNAPYVGEKVTIKVQEEPKVKDDLIAFWWEIKGGQTLSAGPEVNSPDDRAYSFTPQDTKPVMVTVHAKSKENGDDLGEASLTITAKSYAVSIGEPRYLGPKPRIWKCDTQLGGDCPGLVEVSDQQFAVFHDIFMKATVTPALNGATYDWSVEPTGLCGMPGAGDEIKINCSQTGSYEVSVKVRNSDNAEIGSASGTVTISVSQDELERASKAKEVQDKILKAKKKVKEGFLDEGIALIEEAKGLDPKNPEAEPLAQRWKSQKEATDRQLKRIKKLIESSNFKEAKKAFITVKEFYPNYPTVVEIEGLLKEREATHKKQEEIKLAEKKKTADQEKKAGSARKITEVKDLVAQGRLSEAINVAEGHARANPSDQQAVALVKRVKTQKEATDRQLEKIKKLVESSNFSEAKKVLASVKQFHPKYTPVLEADSLLRDREAVQKKEQKRKKSEEIQRTAQKQKEESARKDGEDVRKPDDRKRSLEYYQLDLSVIKPYHARNESVYAVDGIPVSGYNGKSAPIVWLTWCKSPNNDGVCYPNSAAWALPGIKAASILMSANLSWWGNALRGKAVLRLTVSGRGGATCTFNVVVGKHVAEWNGGVIEPASNVAVKQGVPGPSGRWFISRFALGDMEVTQVQLDLLDAPKHGKDQYGVAEIHGITLMAKTEDIAGGTLSKQTVPGRHETSPPGKVSSSSVYGRNTRGDVFQGGRWAGAQNQQAWIQRDFETSVDIAEIYIGRASTDVTTDGFRIVIKLQKENGQWIVVDELRNTNINRTQLSFGNVGKSIPFYRKILAPTVRAKSFRLELLGHGWFDAEDIRIIPDRYTKQSTPLSPDHAPVTKKDSGQTFSIQVSSDRNIIGEPTFEHDVQGNKNIHVVDRNQSRSQLKLIFSDSRLNSPNPRKASLILNVPGIKDAESHHGFLLYQGNVLVGKSGQISRGSQIVISLDLSNLKLSDPVSLIVKGASDDGSYVMSKSSGRGAVLMIEQ